MIKLTGLWRSKDKNGNDVFSGQMSRSARIVIMHNGFKQKPTDPEFYLYVDKEQPREAKVTPRDQEEQF